MKRLKHREEEIMQILWKLKKAFVKEIIAEMDNPKPYNTVSSTVRELQKNGVVGYESFGKTHRYFPILEKEAYRKFSFKKMMENYFGGSPEQLLSFFVNEENIEEDDLDTLLEKLKNK